MNNLTCEIISNTASIDKSKWNDFINRSPFTSIYHRYEFLQAIEEGTDNDPRHIVVFKDDNIIGVFPNFIQPIPRLPFKILYSMDPGFGGPLIGKHEKQVISLMMQQIKHLCKGTILAHYIQTQHPGFIRYHHFLMKQGYHLNTRYSHAIISLNAKTYTDIKKHYYSEKARELHKMEKKNITITDEPVSTDSLTAFHQAYTQTIHRVEGIPYPLKFIIALNKYLPDRLKHITVSLNNEHIGSHLYLINKEQNMLIAWLLAIKEQHHQYYPSTLMHDHMIQWAIQHKFDSYDLGYTIADFQDGLFKYKQEFGATASPLLLWEKSYGIVPLQLIKIGGRLYKRYVRSER